VLFWPFRNELRDTWSTGYVNDIHKDSVENIRKQFEPNRELLLNLEKAMNEYEADETDNPDEDLISEDN